MTINIRKSGAIRRKALSCMILGLLAASAAIPVVAAPGEQAAEPYASVSTQVDQPAGTFGYLWIAGATFHPLDSTTTYSYSGSGCISKTGGSNPVFAHKVVLPEGALVRYLRLYFYDDSTSSVVAFFTTYDGAGNFVERTSIGSTNAVSGYGTTLSPLFSYEVNHGSAPINVAVNMGSQNDSTLRFCGVRIAYDPPITDRIFANGFDSIPL